MGNEVVVQGFNPVSLMPVSFEQKYTMAQTLVKSGLLPQGLNTEEKVCVALEWGHELQLSPMVAVNNIAVINGKPTLSADIMAAVVKRSPEYGGIEWIEQSDTKAECVVKRVLSNGQVESTKSTYTIEDAQKAGLASRDNWKKYPRRMLKHRCLSYALRDMFPDLLAGLYAPEEMESIEVPQQGIRDVTPPTEKNVTPEPSAVIIDERQQLKTIIEKYEAEMNVTNPSGNPYDMACEALAENDPAQISKMLVRVKSYLGHKGIQVA